MSDSLSKAIDHHFLSIEGVLRRILLIRGHKVMLDADLADLYGVSTKALNQAVKRNGERFPADFLFQLTASEKSEVVTNCDHLSNLKFSSHDQAISGLIDAIRQLMTAPGEASRPIGFTANIANRKAN